MRSALVLTLVLCTPTYGAEPGDLDFVTASSLPRIVLEVLATKRSQLSSYVLSAHLNPYYLHGDFDGDGVTDAAILIKERDTQKAGILLVSGGSGTVTVLGAGQQFASRGDDFRSLDAWYVYARRGVARGADQREPPLLRGDALMLEKTESASFLVYWTGSEYTSYQQGD